jgi:apolipoprotein D and lipocalin family protein
MLMNKPIKILLTLCALLLASCTGGPPGGLKVIQNFELERYQGIWFEIARLDHRFERGLSQVSAEYRIQADNTVQVINRGFDEDSGEWEQAVGKARFIDATDQEAVIYNQLLEIAAGAGFAVNELIVVPHTPST